MKKYVFLFFMAVLLSALNAAGLEAADDGWVEMPAGGKSAYMGIHGGTMPVSLLVSQDGSSLYTFVGRTGNDFLEALRKSYMPLPSLGNATRDDAWRPARAGSDLSAGSPQASMPVIPLAGDIFSSGEWLARMQPFGLSSEPLEIEGRVSAPPASSAKRYRLFAWPDFLQPRKAGK